MHQARKALVCSQALPVFRHFGIRQAILFGSLDGRSTARSDVDLLVMSLYWEFRHALEQALKLSVDIYTQDDNLYLVAKVLERGEVIYDA